MFLKTSNAALSLFRAAFAFWRGRARSVQWAEVVAWGGGGEWFRRSLCHRIGAKGIVMPSGFYSSSAVKPSQDAG